MRFLSPVMPVLAVLTIFSPVLFGQGGLSVVNYQLISEQRSTRTLWFVTYGATLVNTGSALSGVTATVTSHGPGMQVVAGQSTLHFPPVPANSSVTSIDTFTVLADSSLPGDFSNLQWSFLSPVANPGPNQTVPAGTNVILNGSGSSNPSGVGTLSYSWAFASRPAASNAVLTNPNGMMASFAVDVPGNYVVTLTVGNGAAMDIASVTVSTVNSPPVANAGPNQTVAVGSTVTLNGSNSSDVDGDSLSYFWTLASQPSGSSVVVLSYRSVLPTFVADQPGTYVVQLVVNDGKVDSAPSTVTIKTTTVDTAPVANAGANQLVSVGALVQLNGAASTDVDGDALTYRWSLITKPANSTATLSNANGVNPTFSADLSGTYVAQLIVNDGKIDSSPATVAVTTNIIQAPTANAGPNQTVVHGTTVSLNGAGSDPQGLPLTWTWALITRPAGSVAALSSSSMPTPTFVVDLPGTYIAQLIVSDGILNSVPSTVTITTTNTPPVANAGPSQNVSIGTLVVLDGKGSSDADHDPLTYSWSLLNRPSGSNASLQAAGSNSPTFIADVAGTFVMQLIVSDPFTSGLPSTMTVTGSVAGGAPSVSNGSAVSAAAPNNAAPPGSAVPISVTPSSGSAGRQLFSFVARDAQGVSSIQYAQFLFSKSGINALNACYVSYDPVGNVFYLLSDDKTQWFGLLAGSANTVGNAQCTIYGATSGSTAVGTDLTTNVDISFRSGFAGLKSVYQFAADTGGGTSGWISMGTWVDTGDPNVVELISLTPNSGSGGSQMFTAVTSDGTGATTIPFVGLVMTAQPISSFSGNGCFIFYARASNVFYLLNDSATAFSGLVAGSASSVSNSQCTLNGVGSGGLTSGSNLTVTYNLTLSGSFTGPKQIYMQAVDNTGIIEVWHRMGTWSVAAASPPAAITVTGGNVQSTAINSAFASPLQVLVADASNNPLAGVMVTFAATPVNGASATLSSPTAVTNASGLASITATANAVAGSYTVGASAGPGLSVNFSLTNQPGTPASLTVAGGNGQSWAINTAFPNPLQVLVTDASKNPLAGVTVTFAVTPVNGAGATPFGPNAVTDASGLASITLTANGIAGGPYTVTATTTGIAGSAAFAETNTALGLSATLTPANLSIPAAGAGTLTLMLPGPAPNNITFTLNSSNPGVATVPPILPVSGGSNIISFKVTAVAQGSTVITASAPGFIDVTANVTVQQPGSFSMSVSNTSFQLEQTASVTITLSQPAPPEGATINLISSDTSKATLSPSSVFISQGNTTGTALITGAYVGSSSISASAPGYTSPAPIIVQIGATIAWVPATLTIPSAGQQSQLGLTLFATVPGSHDSFPYMDGLTVNLTSSRPDIATVPSTVTFFWDGSTQPTYRVPVTAVGPGTALIYASGTNIPQVIAIVTVAGE